LPKWMVALEANSGLEVPNSMAKLIGLIECPVCLEYLRPGTKSVAVCENGHLFCYPCGKRIEDSEFDHCPLCRNEEITFSPNHYLVTNLIDVVSTLIEYKCGHDKCEEEMMGKELLEHQKRCEWKPLQCPRASCKEKVIYKDFLTNDHSCMRRVKGVDKGSVRSWKYVLPFDTLYNFDNHHEEVTAAFKPTLLVPPENEPHDKLCISAGTTGNGIIFYLASLETAEDLSPEIKKKMFVLSVHIYGTLGKIGYTGKVTPVTPNETAYADKHGVSMWRTTYISFLKTVFSQGCKECPNEDVPHLHIALYEQRS
jgi:hypothetical protein